MTENNRVPALLYSEEDEFFWEFLATTSTSIFKMGCYLTTVSTIIFLRESSKECTVRDRKLLAFFIFCGLLHQILKIWGSDFMSYTLFLH